MDAKTPSRPRVATSENFLAEAVRGRQRRVTYGDGFRFGAGFMLAVLVMLLILGGLSWGAIALLHH
ncbi:MAG TPA: hypothetical protein VLI05_07155 [Candidatus Saccharimonadia bacterium]|nr:hypothetical protein [Candidatus Saccharimonadia bacterium]